MRATNGFEQVASTWTWTHFMVTWVFSQSTSRDSAPCRHRIASFV